MPQIKASTHIAAPQNLVFTLATDLRGAPARIKGIDRIEVLTEGPIRKGTRFRETRSMFGRSCTETMEIAEFDPPRSYTVTATSCGCLCRTAFTFRPDAGGTVVEFVFNTTAQTFFAKVISPLFRLMASTCRKMVEKDLADIKAAAEGSAPAAAPAMA